MSTRGIVGDYVVERDLLSVEQLGVVVTASLDQNDGCLRRENVRPLDVQRLLHRPLRVGWRRGASPVAVGVDFREVRRCQRPLRVESGQIAGCVRVIEGVHDDDGAIAGSARSTASHVGQASGGDWVLYIDAAHRIRGLSHLC